MNIIFETLSLLVWSALTCLDAHARLDTDTHEKQIRGSVQDTFMDCHLTEKKADSRGSKDRE